MNFSQGGVWGLGGGVGVVSSRNTLQPNHNHIFTIFQIGVGGHMTDKFFIKGLKNPYIITIIIIHVLDYVQTCRNV